MGSTSAHLPLPLVGVHLLHLPLVLVLLHMPLGIGVRLQTTTLSALETEYVVGVAGHRAFLPCDLTPPSAGEVVYLVLWYRGDEGEPIYSYDARRGSWNLGARWSDGGQFGTRAYFQLSSSPAELRVENVKEGEEGVYRCRVDFKSAPTRNTLVNLTVLVPPASLTLIDADGIELSETAGPYLPGATPRLQCLASGGNPLPEVTWWKEGRLVDSSYETTFTKVVQNIFEVGPLQREDLGTVLTCQANNNNISLPISTRVTLDMVFPPTDVSITSIGQPLSAGTQYEVICEAAGSRPEPTLTWWLGDQFLATERQRQDREGNLTRSTLSLSPSYTDHDRVLTCRAENTAIPEESLVTRAIQDSWKLTVYYPPIVSLRLGLELGSDALDEGQDVYLECKIKANPEIYKIQWSHNGELISQNSRPGMILSGHSLVLQKVLREQAGNYTCLASNLEGDAESNTVLLKILYAPRCLMKRKQSLGANLGSTLTVPCNVDSFPPPLSFSWGFNNSKDALKLGTELYSSNGSQSVLRYQTLSDHHFGTLYCWAQNTKGHMPAPCVFHVIPARPPSPPTHCRLLNQTRDLLQVKCRPGFDGGLDQSFLLEVEEVESGSILANVSSARPLFTITGLNPGVELRLLIRARNSNGRSEATVLEGFATKVAQLQVESQTVPLHFTPFLGILSGAALTLFLIAILVVLIIRKKTQGSSAHIGLNLKSSGSDQDFKGEFREREKGQTPDVIDRGGLGGGGGGGGGGRPGQGELATISEASLGLEV